MFDVASNRTKAGRAPSTLAYRIPQLARAPEHSSLLREGDVVGDKYRVDRPIGEGGMGIIVAARHIELGYQVAIKYLRPSAVTRPDLMARFRCEAQTVVRIHSEHVIRVLDTGCLANGSPYTVMELLVGIDLRKLLESRGAPLDLEEAIDYTLQACEALVEAHAMGIVHRDLKPGNLFLARRTHGASLIKVIDFGISSGLEPEVLVMTPAATSADRAIVGSPAYMSPEQIADFAHVDARADIWSLGAVLFELVTGSLPFDSGSLESTLTKICSDPAPSARERRIDLPWQLDHVIQRCLQMDRTRRIRDVAELADALSPFAAERSKASISRIMSATRHNGLGLRAAPRVAPLGVGARGVDRL